MIKYEKNPYGAKTETDKLCALDVDCFGCCVVDGDAIFGCMKVES